MRSTPRLLAPVCLTLLLAVGVTAVQAQPRPLVVLTVDLETPEGARGGTFVGGRNQRQEIVGSFAGSPVAFLLRQTRPPVFVRCPGDDVITTTLHDINDDGDSVGGCVTETSGFEFGFVRFREGAMQTLVLSGSGLTRPTGLNNQRTVVGLHGQDVGFGGGWMWKRGRFTRLPFDPTAIHNDGTILGFRVDGPMGRVHGVLRDRAGTMTDIDYPGALRTIPFDRNTHGHMVGIFEDATGVHPFIVDDYGWRILTLPHPGAHLIQPSSLTDDGHIAGSFAVPWVHPTDPTITSYWVGFVAMPQPEMPGSAVRLQQQQRSMALTHGDEAHPVPANTFTLQPSHVACPGGVALTLKVHGWQVCESE